MTTAFAQDHKKAEPAIRAFDSYYAETLKKYGIAGSSFVLIADNRVVDRQTFGLAHIEKNYKVDEDTIFHWASITKTLTAIAIMQLRDRGKIRLDDPITKYVPEIKKIHDPFGDTSEITISHLLSHSGGFRAATWPWGGDKDWHPPEPPDWATLAAMMPYTEVEFKPGSKFSYSNPGLVFLGRVIEVVSGEDFEVYMDKNVLKPLEMYNSYYDTTPPHLLRHRSHSYYIEKGKRSEGIFDMNTGVTVSNGGLNAPFPDMIKYLNFLLGDPKLQSKYDAVLKRASLEEMWEPVLDVPDQPKNGQGRRDFMGKCFFIEDNYGRHYIGHSGTQNGFRTHFFIDPKARTGYIVAFNTWVTGTTEDPKATTDRMDQEIKDHLFANVFTQLYPK